MPICLWFSDDWLKDGYMTRHILNVYWLGKFPKYLKYFLISQLNDMTTRSSWCTVQQKLFLKWFSALFVALNVTFINIWEIFWEYYVHGFIWQNFIFVVPKPPVSRLKFVCLCLNLVFCCSKFLWKHCLSFLFR